MGSAPRDFDPIATEAADGQWVDGETFFRIGGCEKFQTVGVRSGETPVEFHPGGRRRQRTGVDGEGVGDERKRRLNEDPSMHQ